MALVECLVDHNVSLYTHEICTVIRELRATVNFTCVYIYLFIHTIYNDHKYWPGTRYFTTVLADFWFEPG